MISAGLILLFVFVVYNKVFSHFSFKTVYFQIFESPSHVYDLYSALYFRCLVTIQTHTNACTIEMVLITQKLVSNDGRA